MHKKSYSTSEYFNFEFTSRLWFQLRIISEKTQTHECLFYLNNVGKIGVIFYQKKQSSLERCLLFVAFCMSAKDIIQCFLSRHDWISLLAYRTGSPVITLCQRQAVASFSGSCAGCISLTCRAASPRQGIRKNVICGCAAMCQTQW